MIQYQRFFEFRMGGYRMSLMVMATRLTLVALYFINLFQLLLLLLR